MDTCDVLIVGGGPAGSACAWKLRAAGLDVLVMDKAMFPRDKTCAGWITPQAIDDLQLDTADYRQGRTFQPIAGFHVGLIGGDDGVDVSYGHRVSFGIRRCEFDHYLLQRSEARLLLGVPMTSMRRDGLQWIVNEAVRASIVVGAGGHFCPLARLLNGATENAAVVSAQEVEFPLDSHEAASIDVAGERPALYFCPDLRGYGWCFRKQNYLNVGFGRLDAHALPQARAEFVDFLTARHAIVVDATRRWRGHAYLLSEPACRRAVDEGVLLAGDAAGLASQASGEGIRPAIESGLMAASTIIEADGCYTRERLEPYQARIRSRFGTSPFTRLLSRTVPGGVRAALAVRLLGSPWFVRHMVLNRWFLHADQPALAPS